MTTVLENLQGGTGKHIDGDVAHPIAERPFQSMVILSDAHPSGEDGSLQGFSTIEVYDRIRVGRKFLAVFSGDTIIEKAYWGQSALQRAFVRYVVTLKLSRPLTPVYWFLISKGYKTYLLLSRNFTSYWPRHDRPTPAWEQGLVNFLATDKYPDDYVPEQGILHFAVGEGRLKSGIAPINPTLLATYSESDTTVGWLKMSTGDMVTPNRSPTPLATFTVCAELIPDAMNGCSSDNSSTSVASLIRSRSAC